MKLSDRVRAGSEAAPWVIEQIERLEAELETERCLSFRNQVAQLESERDAAVKDAERYQWLKQMWTTTLLDGSIQMANSHGIRCKSVSEIDAAIDAARGEA